MEPQFTYGFKTAIGTSVRFATTVRSGTTVRITIIFFSNDYFAQNFKKIKKIIL